MCYNVNSEGTDFMEYIVYIIAGLLAGFATGLVGLSAAIIIAPIFATFLGMDPYTAIGIALASDVFASLISASNYAKKGHINIKGALLLSSTVLVFAVLASYLSFYTKPITLHSTINIFVPILGLRFLIYPVKTPKSNILEKLTTSTVIQTLIWGAVIGFISGFFGSGGGLSMLAVLTMILKYDIKKAIGTSVLVMAVTAFVGSATHFIIGGTLLVPLVITATAALIGANITSLQVVNLSEKKLNRLIGFFLLIDGIILIIAHFFIS